MGKVKEDRRRKLWVSFLNNWAPRTTLRDIAVLVHLLEG